MYLRQFFFAILTGFFAIFAVQGLFAEPDISYREDVTKRIVQRLEWQKDESAFDYFIEIEQADGYSWKNVYSETTAENFVELSLSHGNYRYRIIPSDLLGRRLKGGEWASIIVHQIFQPELINYEPNIFYIDDELPDFEINISGINILNESKWTLRETSKDTTDEGSIIDVKEASAASDGTSANLIFERSALREGIFDIVIENPGGLSAVLKNFRIVKKSSGEDIKITRRFYFTEGYAPVIALPGVFNNIFKSSFFPAGFVMRVGWMPFDFFKTKLGVEFQPSYRYFAFPVSEPDYFHYDISAQFLDIKFNGVWGIPVWRRFMINVRAGIGFAVLFNIKISENILTSPETLGWIFTIGGGASFSWYILQNLYLDIGIDYSYLFSVDSPAPQYIIPALSVGFQF